MTADFRLRAATDAPPGRDELIELYERLQDGRTERPALVDLLDLRGMVAVVTSGGGEGLGQACSHRLAALGAAVHVNDVDGARARIVAEMLQERFDTPPSWSSADAGDYAKVAAAVGAATETLGPIDILVNSVGGGTREPALFSDQAPDEMTAILARNLLAPLNFTRAVLPSMIERRSGSIVNISSEAAAIVDTPVIYGSCKAGVDAFTRILADQVGPLGVRVNSVRPGMIVNQAAVSRVASDVGFEERMRLGVMRASLRRPGQAEEIADVVAFLASPAASYVHGATVRASGGMY